MSHLLRGMAVMSAALLVSGLGPAAAEGGAHPPHWTYSGETGPAKWAHLEKEFQACGAGHAQSPIDIRDSVAVKTDLRAIEFAYKPSALNVVDNGHTVQVTYDPGSFISIGDKRYQLVQFHFHKPSEEKINGKSHDMVAHLVHADADGKLAVVAVLLTAGESNPMLGVVWDHLPKTKETHVENSDVRVNAADLLPQNRGYYTFTGSLTTPPCSEGVTWFVLKNPTPVSAQQIARFGKLYPMNARPVQPLYRRSVAESR